MIKSLKFRALNWLLILPMWTAVEGLSKPKGLLVKNMVNLQRLEEMVEKYADIEAVSAGRFQELIRSNEINADFIILSGGDGREILSIEKQFIRQTKIPVMGICYGHLMIASSFGKPQYHLAVPRLEMLEAVNESLIGSYAFRNSPRTLRYNHSWGVSAADLESADFTIIMKEASRAIEPSSGEQSRGLLQYRIGTEIDLTLAAEYDKDEKYVLSLQGHPESEGVDVDVSDSLFRRFFRKVANFEDIPSEYADARLIAHETTSLSLDVNQEKVYYTLKDGTMWEKSTASEGRSTRISKGWKNAIAMAPDGSGSMYIVTSGGNIYKKDLTGGFEQVTGTRDWNTAVNVFYDQGVLYMLTKAGDIWKITINSENKAVSVKKLEQCKGWVSAKAIAVDEDNLYIMNASGEILHKQLLSGDKTSLHKSVGRSVDRSNPLSVRSLNAFYSMSFL